MDIGKDLISKHARRRNDFLLSYVYLVGATAATKSARGTRALDLVLPPAILHAWSGKSTTA